MVNPNIILQATQRRGPSPMQRYGQAVGIKNALTQQEAARTALDRDKALRNALTDATATGSLDMDAYRAAVMQHGSPGDVLALQKSGREQALHDVKLENAQLDQVGKRAEAAGRIAQTMVDDQSYFKGIEALKGIGANIGKMPPRYSKPHVDALTQSALTVQQDVANKLAEKKFGETKRHNEATEGNAVTLVGDLESPTGSRYVKSSKAAGQPGKAPSTWEIESTPEGGFSMRQGPDRGMAKKIQGAVEGKLLTAGDTLAGITAIKARYKPEFQTIGTRFGMKWDALRDKINPKTLRPDEKAQLDEYSQYRAEAGQLFALTLKDLSGVAVNPTEFKRAEAWLPNPGTGLFDGDSPTELEAKTARFEEFTRKALMKAAYIRKNGLTVNDVDVDQMPGLMQKRGDAIASELSGQLQGDQLIQAVKQGLADEFGLAVY